MRLRELKIEDVDNMLEWMRDESVSCGFRDGIAQTTYVQAVEFINAAKTKCADGKSVHFAIADSNDEYLGTVSLKHIDVENSNGEYAIALRSIAQGKGIGTWATKQILKIAFEEFRLNKVYLNVLSHNIKAIRLYERCGFEFEGKSKEHVFIGGEFKDLLWYSMLRKDYIN